MDANDWPILKQNDPPAQFAIDGNEACRFSLSDLLPDELGNRFVLGFISGTSPFLGVQVGNSLSENSVVTFRNMTRQHPPIPIF